MVKKGIKGFDVVKANLAREIAAIQNRSMKGLILAAAHIRNDMDKTPPLIPIDTGNLRASWFTSSHYTEKGPGLVIGFSANYAVFVHENMEATFQRPGAGPKFFEAALNRNHNSTLRIIQENAKIR